MFITQKKFISIFIAAFLIFNVSLPPIISSAESDSELLSVLYGDPSGDGKITSFDEAYEISLKDFTNDMKMLKAKRDEGVYTMGKDVMTKFCDETKVMNIHAHNMGETKQALVDSGACKADLTDMQLQAITLYYWDIKLNNFEKNYGKL